MNALTETAQRVKALPTPKKARLAALVATGVALNGFLALVAVAIFLVVSGAGKSSTGYLEADNPATYTENTPLSRLQARYKANWQTMEDGEAKRDAISEREKKIIEERNLAHEADDTKAYNDCITRQNELSKEYSSSIKAHNETLKEQDKLWKWIVKRMGKDKALEWLSTFESPFVVMMLKQDNRE